MNKIFSLGLLISLIVVSCTDPNTIGLEVQPTSDNIIISSASFEGITSNTESEDSLRTDEALNLILGKIIDPYLLIDGCTSRFLTQILLTENNTDLGTDPIVDSVVLSYTYSGYYGELEKFNNDLMIRRLDQPIYKDSTYYSNFSYLDNGEDLFSSFMLSTDELNPLLKVNLDTTFAQDLFNLGNEAFVDNETFLTHFNGLSVSCDEDENTMLYLNPDGSNSYLKIYYHNDDSDSLSLDFELGIDAARINLFNSKPLSNLIQEVDKRYIQSMAGYKMKIAVNNTDSIKALLAGKAINKVTMSFDVDADLESDYAAHDKLFLVRVDEEGNNIFLSDYTIEGETHFGGNLENERYEFNITRYFYQLLNNSSYTNDLYLLPAGAAVNANRTILDKDIILTIHYSQL